MLTDEHGNPTAHIVGLFNRTIQFLESGIKPVWVFDGKPPNLKSNTLNKRKRMKDESKEIVENAREDLNPSKDTQSSSKNKLNSHRRFQSETHITEARQRARLMEVYGVQVPQIQSQDFYCEGESEPEDARSAQRFQEMDDLVSCLERRGHGMFSLFL